MGSTLNFVLSDPNGAADRIEALEAALRECCTELEYYSRCEWRSAEGGKISKFNTTAIVNRARARLKMAPDCPCGGWDCTGAPEGPMYGCPYVAQTVCDHRQLQDGELCPVCGCRGNGEA